MCLSENTRTFPCSVDYESAFGVDLFGLVRAQEVVCRVGGDILWDCPLISHTLHCILSPKLDATNHQGEETKDAETDRQT